MYSSGRRLVWCAVIEVACENNLKNQFFNCWVGSAFLNTRHPWPASQKIDLSPLARRKRTIYFRRLSSVNESCTECSDLSLSLFRFTLFYLQFFTKYSPIDDSKYGQRQLKLLDFQWDKWNEQRIIEGCAGKERRSLHRIARLSHRAYADWRVQALSVFIYLSVCLSLSISLILYEEAPRGKKKTKKQLRCAIWLT